MRPKVLVLTARNIGRGIHLPVEIRMYGCVYGCPERMGISMARDEAEGLARSRKQHAAWVRSSVLPLAPPRSRG